MKMTQPLQGLSGDPYDDSTCNFIQLCIYLKYIYYTYVHLHTHICNMYVLTIHFNDRGKPFMATTQLQRRLPRNGTKQFMLGIFLPSNSEHLTRSNPPKCGLILPSGKLTVRPWQSSGLEDEFPLKLGYFQGPTVNLPEGNSWFMLISS